MAAILLISSCSNPFQKIIDQFNKAPEIDAVTRAIKTSMPLAFAADIAMDAVNGSSGTGVTVVTRTPLDSFPCNAVVRISVDPSRPLPVGSASVTGSMMVAGLFSDTSSAVVSVFFTNTNIRDGTFTVKNVAFVPAVRDTSGTMVVFASEDVNADSAATFSGSVALTASTARVLLDSVPKILPLDSAVAVSQKAWITIVKRPSGGSIGEATYTLLGASQYLGVTPSKTEVIQAVMLNVKMTPWGCRLNPSSGVAMIRDIRVQDANSIAGIELGTTLLTFKSACDGRGNITLATGCYLGRTGSTAGLNLDR